MHALTPRGGPGATPTEQGIQEVLIGRQRVLVIPDPEPLIQARIIVAIEAGRQAILADAATPELVTRALLQLREQMRNDDVASYLKSSLKHFIEGVQGILEAAYSLRAIHPNIHLLGQLEHNIAGLHHVQGNNLVIAVGGAILAEEVLDRELPDWREQRDNDPLSRLRAAIKNEVVKHYSSPPIYRGSETEQTSKMIVRIMLLHLLRSAGAQELVGEEGCLTVELPSRIEPPIKQSVTAGRLSGPGQS